MSKKPRQPNDTSNVVDITQIQEQYQDSSLKIQLERYQRDNLILMDQLRDLKDSLLDKEAKIVHLESLLKSQTPIVGSYQPILGSPITDEEEIALKQLEILKQASHIRPLSLEEIKIYDLLVKNKRLAQGSSTQVIDTIKLPKEKTKLIELASKKINEQTEN